MMKGCDSGSRSYTDFCIRSRLDSQSYSAERLEYGIGESLELLVGDVIQISFPGASELSGERIRRDGKITLAFVGRRK